MRNELHGWSQMETTRVNLSGGRDGYSCAVQFERENRRCDRCFRGPWRGRRAGDGLCGGQRGGVLQLRQGTAGHSDLRNRRRGCGDKALQGKFVQPGRDPATRRRRDARFRWDRRGDQHGGRQRQRRVLHGRAEPFRSRRTAAVRYGDAEPLRRLFLALPRVRREDARQPRRRIDHQFQLHQRVHGYPWTYRLCRCQGGGEQFHPVPRRAPRP